MSRFLTLFLACLYPFFYGIDIHAQTTDSAIQIDAVITDVRAHEEPRGFFIDPPDPVGFVQIAPTTLETPGTRIFSADRTQRLALQDLQTGTRVSIAGVVDGAAIIASEIVILQTVRHIWLDGVVIDIQREGTHQGQISLLEFGERLDKRARVFIDGEDMGTGLQSIIDLLNRTRDPVVATVSERNAFEQNWLFGRVDIAVGTPQPIRSENDDVITFQLPADPDEAVYQSEHENALREMPTTIPISESTIIRSEAQEGAEVSLNDLPLYARVTVNASLSGTDLLQADINIANIPREVRQTFHIDGIDPVSRIVNLGVGEGVQMSSDAPFFDREGNPVSPREFDARQWGESKLVARIDIDPNTHLGTQARLIEWQTGITPGPNQVIMGAVGDIHRGVWVDHHTPAIGTRSLSGIFTPDTVIRLPDGTPVSRAQLDWGAQAEVGGFVARDELIVREIVFQNVIRQFELTTTLGEFKAEHQWMSFEPASPFRAASTISVVDHFGDPITLSLLSDLLQQLDLQLRLTFVHDTDGTRLVSRIEAFRPDDDVQVQLGQEILQGAHIRPFDEPALIFPQGIDNAHFNRNLEVNDTFGSRVDPRVLTSRIPVRVHGLLLLKNRNGHTERIARVHRIDILGSERLTYRGTLRGLNNNTLIFRTPESFTLSGHTDLREETGLQTDFITLAGRIRSENGLRMHLSADFNTSGNPEVWWARILRADESEPAFLSEHERIVTIVSADETRRTLTPQTLPDIQITSETQIVDISGDPLSRNDLVTDARITVETEMQGGVLTAIEIRIETRPQNFTLTADLQRIDFENRVIQFASPNEILIAQNALFLNTQGEEISLSQFVSQLRNQDTRLVRITHTPDSNTDTPVATQLEMVTPETEIALSDLQTLIYVEDPGGQINTHDRRIHPRPVPTMVVAQDAEITDQTGQTIPLKNLSNRIRVRLIGHDTQDRLIISNLQIMGPILETSEGTIAAVDVANRIITPAPEPAQPIHRRGSFATPAGQRVTLADFAEAVSQNPDYVLKVYNDPFADGIQAMHLLDPRHVSGEESDVELYRASEVVIDATNAQLTFVAYPPVQVAEGVSVTGPNGETWTLNDLQEGQRIFVRGYSENQNFVITAIFVRPQINSIHVRPEIFAADNDGIENDVRVAIVDQNDTPVAESLRLQVNYNEPEDIQTGHVVHNLPAGPHIFAVNLPERVGFNDRVRVFISAQGTAFRITKISPDFNATNVPTTTDIAITFNEPLHQIGDYLAIEGTLIPDVNDESEPEIHDDGRTLILRDFQLAENTDYTIVIFSATSTSGNSLGQTFRSRFSTGGALTQPSGLAGLVTLSENVRFVGSAHLFNTQNEPISEIRLSENGAFDFNDIGVGSYHLYINVRTEDGRTISTFYDADNNNQPDDIALAQGQIHNNLNFTLNLPQATEPENTDSNANAAVALDLDVREGNQNQLRVETTHNNNINVAVYAQGVTNLIGYEVTLNYDAEKLAFQGVSDENGNENSLLQQNGGLAVSLPPVVTNNRVTFASGILGATQTQAVSGQGLLGIFHFRVRGESFTGTEVRLPRVVLQTQHAADILSAGLRAEVVPSQTRYVMRLKHTRGEEPFNGHSTAIIQAEIVDALGAIAADGIPVSFTVRSGDGFFTQTESRTQNGVATSELRGSGEQHIVVTAGNVTEDLTIRLQSTTTTEPATLSTVVLDLNTNAGDQGQRSISAPNVGDTFTIDLVATQDALGLAGYQVVLEYDATHFTFERFGVTDVFVGASPITIPETGRVSINVAFLGTGPTTQSAGSMGQAVFSVAEGFQAPSDIKLTSAIFSSGSDQKTLELGSGTTATIGVSPSSNTPSSDFDGDGEVGFTDFIMFAQAFGSSQGDDKYEARFDLDSSGDLGFPDFIAFAQAFGKPAGKPIRASKVIGTIHPNAQIHLQSQATTTPEKIELTLQLSDGAHVQGYGLIVHYDPSALAFSGITNAQISQFASEQDVALLTEHQKGTIHLSDLLHNPVQSTADLATLQFHVLDPTAVSNVEIAQVFISDPAGQITTLAPKHTQVRATPAHFALKQNHPNPFNPETVVPFTLPEASDMHLAIYNVLGQEIRQLVSGVKDAGFHRITWDGKDQNGQALASGIYFVRLQAGAFSSVRKMMLIK